MACLYTTYEHLHGGIWHGKYAGICAGGAMSFVNIWDLPVYKGDPEPKECKTCGRTGERLAKFTSGYAECGHVECPIRKHCTAAAPDRPEGLES